MSSANAEMSTPKEVTTRAAMACSMAARSSRVIACIASQNRRWSSTAALILVNRSAAVVFHQSANARLEQGSTSRFIAASASKVPTEAPASDRRAPATSSITSTTPSRWMNPHTAATSPNARCRVRSGRTASSRASSSASMSTAEPR